MKNKFGIYIATASLLIVAFVFAAKMYKSSQREELKFLSQQKNEVFVRDHSPRYGNEKAKVFLIEFLDPECESCRMFYPMVKNLLKEFEGKVQLVVRYAPFHHNSQVAIRALEAARLQGKYWEALETLFNYQPNWGDHHNPRPELIFGYLAELGLDMEKLKSDMISDKIGKMMEQDFKDLRTLNVRKTPSFFVNGKPLERFGIDYLRSLIQQEVNLNYP